MNAKTLIINVNRPLFFHYITNIITCLILLNFQLVNLHPNTILLVTLVLSDNQSFSATTNLCTVNLN